jgi:DNA-binding GntR family transcriptional regulator
MTNSNDRPNRDKSAEYDATPVVSRIVRAVQEDIAAGRSKRGERIVEAELARVFEVSRGPVREALRHLAARGLIEQRDRRGWAVRTMSQHDVRELYEVREVLEGQAAALAAARCIDSGVRDQVVQLRDWLSQFENDLPGYVAELENRDRFHDELADLADNTLLSSMLEQIRPLILQMQFRGFIFRTRPQESLSEHIAILDALLDCDSKLADELTRAHIRSSRDVLLKLPADVFA